MKKLLLSIISVLVCTLTAQAQTIRKGDKFFDGSTLYTVQEVRMGSIVYMTSGDPMSEPDSEVTLEKVKGKQGEYTLQPSRQADEPPFLFAEFGWRVQYVSQEGMNFLALRKPNGDAMHILVLTPDNLENCLAQQETLESELPSDILCTALLNKTYLEKIPREELRIMRNEILARHGYRFESKELQELFEPMPWYKPCKDNKAIRLNIIERTNIEMIKSEEALPAGLHPADVAGDVDQSDFEE
jgi:hypothetical protein